MATQHRQKEFKISTFIVLSVYPLLTGIWLPRHYQSVKYQLFTRMGVEQPSTWQRGSLCGSSCQNSSPRRKHLLKLMLCAGCAVPLGPGRLLQGCLQRQWWALDVRLVFSWCFLFHLEPTMTLGIRFSSATPSWVWDSSRKTWGSIVCQRCLVPYILLY